MNVRPLRVTLADADPSSRRCLRSILSELGHDDVRELLTADDLRHCSDVSVDLIIADINIIEFGGLPAIAKFFEQHEVPVVITSSTANDDAIDLADACRPLAHLVKPIRKQDLRAAISLSMQRFGELRTLRVEADNYRQALEDRKTIERAKGIVMRTRKLDEADAFQHIQKAARDQREPLVVVAKSIVIADNALGGMLGRLGVNQ